MKKQVNSYVIPISMSLVLVSHKNTTDRKKKKTAFIHRQNKTLSIKSHVKSKHIQQLIQNMKNY
jgi:hypothetical protein